MIIVIIFFVFQFIKSNAQSLSIQDQTDLTSHLQILSSGWVQNSVNAANTILSNPLYSSIEWEEFFNDYFSTNDYTNDLRGYIGYPVFFWFSSDVHINLQKGLIQPLFNLIDRIMNDNKINLGNVLKNNENIKMSLFNSHQFFNDIGKYGEIDDGEKKIIYDLYVNHVNVVYSDILKDIVTIDVGVNPFICSLRAAVYMVMVDLFFPIKNDQVRDIIGINGKKKTIWDDYSVLVMDNNGLDSTQLDVMSNLFSKLPSEFELPRGVTVVDFFGEHIGFSAYSSINIFGSKVGSWSENSFPSDIESKEIDGFTAVLIHEVNHIIDALYIKKTGNKELSLRKDNIIADCDCPHMNYLRSMISDCFFKNAPQEFFASLSNEWFTDSLRTLQLGLNRFRDGSLKPINQALFFANVYSIKSEKTLFYEFINGDIMKVEVDIKKNSSNKLIEAIAWNETEYQFSYLNGWVSDISICYDVECKMIIDENDGKLKKILTVVGIVSGIVFGVILLLIVLFIVCYMIFKCKKSSYENFDVTLKS